MITLDAVTYTYPGGTRVGPVDLRVAAGEFVLLTGPTGCGKSTALRLAAGLLQRHGQGAITGAVRVGGHDPAALVAAARVATLGFVGQDPDDTVIGATCLAEVAFALESAGHDGPTVDARARAWLDRVGLVGLADRDPWALSGGQRQRLAIGAALAAGARALLLDEPLSQLDPDGAAEVLSLLRGLAGEGVAVLLVEHRLEQAWPVADRTVLMAEGRLVSDPVPDADALLPYGLRGPALDTLRRRAGPGPWRVRGTPPSPVAHLLGAPVFTSSDLTFAWPDTSPCINDVSLTVQAGERVALVGGNGAGKSTLVGLVSGRLRPRTGRVARAPGGHVEVPQNPDLSLFCATVAEELAYGPREARLGPAEVRARVDAAADALSVADLLDRPPQALSRGQRLRVAVAAALACRPRLLLLDEPTSGQDRDQVDRMLDAVAGSLADGALVFASHDLDVVLRHATRVVVLDGGRVVGDGPPLPTLAAAAQAGLPLRLPPLAEVCRSLGIGWHDVDALAAVLVPA